jgi:negative regulator of flagellin synthesis FlgM
MKIGNPSDKPVNGAGGSTRTEGTKGTTQSGGATRTDGLDDGVEASAKVTLSTLAGNLLGGADPAFNAGKVNSVKAAIDNGTYQVKPEVIADKLIANAKELLVRDQS